VVVAPWTVVVVVAPPVAQLAMQDTRFALQVALAVASILRAARLHDRRSAGVGSAAQAVFIIVRAALAAWTHTLFPALQAARQGFGPAPAGRASSTIATAVPDSQRAIPRMIAQEDQMPLLFSRKKWLISQPQVKRRSCRDPTERQHRVVRLLVHLVKRRVDCRSDRDAHRFDKQDGVSRHRHGQSDLRPSGEAWTLPQERQPERSKD